MIQVPLELQKIGSLRICGEILFSHRLESEIVEVSVTESYAEYVSKPRSNLLLKRLLFFQKINELCICRNCNGSNGVPFLGGP